MIESSDPFDDSGLDSEASVIAEGSEYCDGQVPRPFCYGPYFPTRYQCKPRSQNYTASAEFESPLDSTTTDVSSRAPPQKVANTSPRQFADSLAAHSTISSDNCPNAHSGSYFTMGKQPHLYTFKDADELAASLRKYVVEAQGAALERHDAFKIAVSGGSLPKTLAKALLAPSSGSDDALDFSKWEIFFADERAVPLDHEDSNYKLLKDELLDKIPSNLGKPTIHPINVNHLGDATELADDYMQKLRDSFAKKDSVKLPIFDLLLLGCGPDGHTCSLFPKHDLLNEKDSWVGAIEDSPKPPPKRITLTLPVVTSGIRIAFVATGGGKKAIMQEILDSDEGRSLPCGLVNEQGAEKVSWFTDEAAVEGVRFPRRGNL